MRAVVTTLALAICGPAAAQALPPALHAWRPGTVYPVATAPGRVTDIALEPGERLIGEGAVAAGDTARWVIGQSESGSGAQRQAHVLVKPTEPGLATNLVLNTDRRTYYVELRATAASWVPQVAWRYPAGELIALKGGPQLEAPAAAMAPGGLPAEVPELNFAWRIAGDAPFRPARVYDDGRRTYIEFGPEIAAGDLPPLFRLSEGGQPELVNVRVRGRRMIVDRLLDRAELRLGEGRRQARVRLVREARP